MTVERLIISILYVIGMLVYVNWWIVRKKECLEIIKHAEEYGPPAPRNLYVKILYFMLLVLSLFWPLRLITWPLRKLLK